MPKNFADVWLGRVHQNLEQRDQVPWLVGVSEINAPIIVVGEGTDSESQKIYIPRTDFSPDVLVNNTTYPLALQNYTDTTIEIALDKFQTKPTQITDDQALGATYDKIDTATKTHTQQINVVKYEKSLHAIAPDANDTETPVLITSGADDGTGRKKLTKSDVVKLKKAFDLIQVPMTGRRLVLCPEHIADWLEQDQAFANQYYNHTEGRVTKMYGFEIYEATNNPYFTASTLTKKSFGAIPGDGDYQASVAFYVENIAKKTGYTKQYFSEAKSDPEYQTNKLNYRHYYITIPKTKQYIGALVSGVAITTP